VSTAKNIQIMERKRGKWYCYFCGEEITSLDRKHYEKCELDDVDITEGEHESVEIVSFKFRWKNKKEGK
jgi:hypothetical protein